MRSVFRQKTGALHHEKKSHSHASRLMPMPTRYSNIRSFGHDHANAPHSTGKLANAAVIIVLSQSLPTQATPSRSGSSTCVNMESRASSNYLPDESGPSSEGIAQPSLTSEEESCHSGDVPNLTGQVAIATSRPAFEGTYSSIYRGTYKNQEVAVKAIRAVKNGKAMRRKIRREIETWWVLQHPNVLPCMGYVETDGLGEYGAMVSPWCTNGNAVDYLAKNPPSFRRVEMLLDVARGLRYLHQFNPIVVHGDLKPANILIDDACNAKLCDFALVRLIQEDDSSTGMTTTTAHTGTARYLARELVECEQIPTPASDIHALGCLGLEFIFSRIPYSQIHSEQGNAHYKICREISRGVPPASRPAKLDDILADFWSLLESCWQDQDHQRPTANAIVEYLERHDQEIVNSRQHMLEHP